MQNLAKYYVIPFNLKYIATIQQGFVQDYEGGGREYCVRANCKNEAIALLYMVTL